MVHLETIRKMEEFYLANLRTYIQDHPDEWVFIQEPKGNFQVSFYKTEGDLKNACKNHARGIGRNSYAHHIPHNDHCLREDNKRLEFRLTEHVTICPNDQETPLVSKIGIGFNWEDGKLVYHEIAVCPDYHYKVHRKPSDDDIAKVEEIMNQPIGSSV